MMLQLDDLKPFIDWLQANPGLAGFAVFLISCAESLAIIGLFIPGSIIMPAIGGMIGAGVLPAYWIILAAILGAILGDNLSYWIGYHFHDQIRMRWPFNRYPKLLNKGEKFFYKYGGISVFIGRFAGPIRPIIPVVAGMLTMSPARFFLANISSAIAWAIVYIAPGILLGVISEQLAPHVGARLLVILALIMLAIWLITWLLNKAVNYLHKIFEHVCTSLWKKISTKLPKLQVILHHKHLNNHKPFAIILYIIFLMCLLSATAISMTHHSDLTFLDRPVFVFLRSIEIPPLDNMMAYFFYMSSATTLLSIATALIIWLIYRKSWRVMIYWLANITLTYLIQLYAHQRTFSAFGIDTHSSLFYSSPTISLGIFTALLGNFLIPAYYTTSWLRYKKLYRLLLAILIITAASPIVYFGFHTFSQCVASVLCAAISTWICILFFHRKPTTFHLKPTILIAIVVGLTTTIFTGINQSQMFIALLEKPRFDQQSSLHQWWNNAEQPLLPYRNNVLGDPTEPMSVQYAGNLSTLIHTLEKQNWQVAPKPSLAVILNRIGAKNRKTQLPLLPDLYQDEKPTLIMSKEDENSKQMLILRLWSSTILLEPNHTPLWIGTIHFHHPWHWRNNKELINDEDESSLLILQTNLKKLPNKILQPNLNNCTLFCQQLILKILEPSKHNDL